jgi:hypothetical protein
MRITLRVRRDGGTKEARGGKEKLQRISGFATNRKNT